MTDRPAPPPLPADLSPLVGREGLLAPACALLQRPGVRLVTLTGPGGVGKTRIALAAADQLREAFPDGIWFIPLAAIRDPDLVLPEIASVLGVRETRERRLSGTLAAILDGQILLVLDNLEQILDAAPALAELLARSPSLTVLATSRSVLRISGEWTIPVPPLALARREHQAPEELVTTESIRLFVTRAQAAAPEFTLTAENAPTVVEICRRLDGLPLALELAASRLRHLPVDALLARLEQRLPLLTGGPRDQPARLRTMRDAIAWSYRLLSPADQRLLCVVATFVGGFTVESVMAVTGNDDEASVLDHLSQLVDSSLIQQVPDAAGRYRMLETIREFGLEQLVESGSLAQEQSDHASWCVSLVEAAWPAFSSRIDQEPWLARVAAEQDNLRAALAWLLSEEDPRAVQVAGGLFWFWFVRGHLAEGRRWLDQALASPTLHRAPPEHQARALLGAAVIAHFQGDDAAAQTHALAARERAEPAGFVFGQAAAPLTLGIIAEDRGAFDEAIPFLQEALEASQRAGDRANETLARYHLGVVTWGLGRPAQAAEHWEEALAGQRALGDRWGTANTLARLGLLLALRDDLTRSAALLRESLELRYAFRARDDIASGLANIAVLAVACQQFVAAANLFGAETGIRESLGSTRKLPEQLAYERAEAVAADALGDRTFAAETAAGRSMPVEDAVDLAFRIEATQMREGPAGSGDAAIHARLTVRELEVLRLVATGRTNAEIAGALFISASTVRVHVSNVLAKLDARTRTEAVDQARRHGLI